MNRYGEICWPAVFVAAVLLTGCATSPTSESVGEYIDNSVITTKVKSRLAASEQTSALDIGVESYKGVVQLSGFVRSPREAAAAEDIAASIAGVKRVENKLTVIGHETSAADGLARNGS